MVELDEGYGTLRDLRVIFRSAVIENLLGGDGSLGKRVYRETKHGRKSTTRRRLCIDYRGR